jgi:DNA-binding transcriptional MocR family regulator
VRILDDLSTPDGETRVIGERPSQKDLANLVGCSRERVTRILAELVRGGYLAVEGEKLRFRRKLPPAWLWVHPTLPTSVRRGDPGRHTAPLGPAAATTVEPPPPAPVLTGSLRIPPRFAGAGHSGLQFAAPRF